MPLAPSSKPGDLYLGGRYDLDAGQLLDEAVHYDSRDLVTHGVCIGMTGSGKTGLGVSLIEEAAIDHVPVIAIDPNTGAIVEGAGFPAPDDIQGKVTLLLRPDAARLEAGAQIQLQGILKEVSFRGGIVQATLAVNGVALQFQFPATVSLPEPGSSLSLGFEPAEAIQIFPQN